MLIGLGLGPGEPEYLTLRAVRLLREADAVFVPGTIARDLVAPYRDAEVLDFPMTGDEGRIRACMEQNADRIAEVAQSGMAVLGILGDPNFFSTYSRLNAIMKTRYPAISCRTEPGISAITAFASVAGLRSPVDSLSQMGRRKPVPGSCSRSGVPARLRTCSEKRATARLSWLNVCAWRRRGCTETMHSPRRAIT